MISDIIVVIVTWRQNYKTCLQVLQQGIQAPLITLILKDGTIYFITMIAVNIVQAVIYIVTTTSGLNKALEVTYFLTVFVSHYLHNFYT